MKSSGWKRFDEIVGEDGQKYAIQVHKETGEFKCEIPSMDPGETHRTLERFANNDLAVLRREVEGWLKDNATLDFVPVVVVKGREKRWGVRSGSEVHLELDYKRYFRATRKDGTFIWKHYNEHNDTPGHTVTDVYLNEEKKVLRYTNNLWQGLRAISALIQQTNDRLQGLLDANELEGMLVSIALRGTRALLAPKPEDTEVKA